MDDNGTGKKIPIEYTKWGLADYVEDTIFLNKELKKKRWQKLHNKLLEHEQAHNPGPYTQADLKNDLKKTSLDLDLLTFLIQNWKAWTQFSPIRIYSSKRKIYFDRQLIILYLGIFFTAVISWILL